MGERLFLHQSNRRRDKWETAVLSGELGVRGNGRYVVTIQASPARPQGFAPEDLDYLGIKPLGSL